METSQEFQKWYHKLWPIHRFELSKIVPLIILKFLVSFIYSIFDVMKDTLVVTSEGGGAEVIPVLKGFFVLPLALICAIAYSKLSNIFKPSTLFYSIIGFFLCITLLYGFVLYPNMESLTPSTEWITRIIGDNHPHWVAIYKHWYHSLFFVVSELWASVVIFLLFWGFANQITTVSEAKRTYTLMIAAGDIATLATGWLITHFITTYAFKGYSFTLQSLIALTTVLGLGMIFTYRWMQKHVIDDDHPTLKNRASRKTKLSLMASIKHIARSKHLFHIAILVIGCALTINIIEVSFKALAKIEYPSQLEYQLFMGKLRTYVGFVALITVFFFSGGLLRLFGWRFSAQITPLALGIGGLIFLSLTLAKDHIAPFTTLIGMTPVTFLVGFGMCQFVLGKVVKYSFFDTTKEMAFIPLDQESKVKGKAAIDLVGSRFGKSGSSWLQIGLLDLIGTGSVLSITPFLLPVIALMVFAWSRSVSAIGKELDEKESSTPAAA
jgi:AAA family ATP:ADP antiporter